MARLAHCEPCPRGRPSADRARAPPPKPHARPTPKELKTKIALWVSKGSNDPSQGAGAAPLPAGGPFTYANCS